MSNRTAVILVLSLILLSLLAAVVVYPILPERVASHWNAQGEVDGYSSRFWGVALIPMMLVGISALLWFIPSIDPLKANIQTFRPAYNLFIVAMVLYLLYVYGVTLAANLGISFNMSLALIPAFAGLSYLLGVLLSQARRNFFIGVRTPWTLSSDFVWEKTHRLGAKLFKWAAPLTLLGFFFPTNAFAFLIVPLLGISLFLVVYSYLLYQKETARGQ